MEPMGKPCGRLGLGFRGPPCSLQDALSALFRMKGGGGSTIHDGPKLGFRVKGPGSRVLCLKSQNPPKIQGF